MPLSDKLSKLFGESPPPELPEFKEMTRDTAAWVVWAWKTIHRLGNEHDALLGELTTFRAREVRRNRNLTSHNRRVYAPAKLLPLGRRPDEGEVE